MSVIFDFLGSDKPWLISDTDDPSIKISDDTGYELGLEWDRISNEEAIVICDLFPDDCVIFLDRRYILAKSPIEDISIESLLVLSSNYPLRDDPDLDLDFLYASEESMLHRNMAKLLSDPKRTKYEIILDRLK